MADILTAKEVFNRLEKPVEPLLSQEQVIDCIKNVKLKLEKTTNEVFTLQEINYVDKDDPNQETRKEIHFKVKSLNNEYVKKIVAIIAESFFNPLNFSYKKVYQEILNIAVDENGKKLFSENERGKYKKAMLLDNGMYGSKIAEAVRYFEKTGIPSQMMR